jgi:hypothetical protein
MFESASEGSEYWHCSQSLTTYNADGTVQSQEKTSATSQDLVMAYSRATLYYDRGDVCYPI